MMNDFEDFNEEEYFKSHPEYDPRNISCEELAAACEDELYW